MPLSDQIIDTLKDNVVVALVVVAATIIGAVAAFTDAGKKIIDLIWPPERRAAYRALKADLENLERAWDGLGALRTSEWFTVQTIFHLVEVAAEPVCNARKGVSELGDVELRQKLDAVCVAFETMKSLFALPQQKAFPEETIALAAVTAFIVKEAREKVASRV